jgi:D-serine deaminase-like pyridoxal phosphate-dependent protein
MTDQPTPIAAQLTPALLLDPERMAHNIERMRAKMAGLGVGLRPHVKTAKCLEVIRRMTGGVPGPVTVSTLLEAEQLAAAGYTDIVYAVGLTPNKQDRVRALRRGGVDLKVILDSVETAEALAAGGGLDDSAVPALIEIDSDGHRAGAKPHDGALLNAIASRLTGGAALAGVLTHAGESYSARSHAEIRDYAVLERDGAVTAANLLREAGHVVDMVSIGSTPSVLYSDDMTGVTEARAGVYVFFDLVMAGITACTIDEIALSVLTSVNTVQAERDRYLIDAGWTAMSRDRGTASQPVDQGYGIVCDVHGKPYPDLIMTECNQEHGAIALRPGSTASLPDLSIGDLVRILPNHACATAGQHSGYLVTDEAKGVIVDRWARFGGW